MRADSGVGTLDWGYAYDGDGDFSLRRDPKGRTALLQYGPLDRLAHETYPDESIDRTYDGNDTLLGVTEHKASGDETMSRETDELARIKSETRYDGKQIQTSALCSGRRGKSVETTTVYASLSDEDILRAVRELALLMRFAHGVRYEAAMPGTASRPQRSWRCLGGWNRGGRPSGP